jgi:hypothetical protein
MTPSQLGYTPVDELITPQEFRRRVERAMTNAFGSSTVDRTPDKHIEVAAGSNTLTRMSCRALHATPTTRRGSLAIVIAFLNVAKTSPACVGAARATSHPTSAAAWARRARCTGLESSRDGRPELWCLSGNASGLGRQKAAGSARVSQQHAHGKQDHARSRDQPEHMVEVRQRRLRAEEHAEQR